MRLLIAEDDDVMRKALVSKFESAGFDVLECKNGNECLAELGKEKVDGIILDILMPGKGGYQVLQELVDTHNEGTPVYVVTSLGREEDCEKAKQLGAKVCYVKSEVSLKDVIREVKEDLGA